MYPGVGLLHFCAVVWALGNGLALDLGPTWRLWLYLYKPEYLYHENVPRQSTNHY